MLKKNDDALGVGEDMMTEEWEAYTRKKKNKKIQPIQKMKTNKRRNKANKVKKEKAKQVPRRSPGCQEATQMTQSRERSWMTSCWMTYLSDWVSLVQAEVVMGEEVLYPFEFALLLLASPYKLQRNN